MKTKRASYWVNQDVGGCWSPIAVRTTRDGKVMAAEVPWNTGLARKPPQAIRIHGVVLVLNSKKPLNPVDPWLRYERPA